MDNLLSKGGCHEHLQVYDNDSRVSGHIISDTLLGDQQMGNVRGRDQHRAVCTAWMFQTFVGGKSATPLDGQKLGRARYERQG
jgi:hypothetical protein